MPGPERSLMRQSLAVPAVGEQATIQKGPLKLILRHEHGGVCLLTPHPERPQRHVLGLPGEGWLELAAHAPEYRVRVHLTDRMSLAPGGRVHGYLTVPLPHRLSWCRSNTRKDALLEVAPKELRTSWLGEGPDGGYQHETESAFHLTRRGLAAETVALVPVFVANHTGAVVSPEVLTVSLRDRDMRELDGQIITSPRRLQFDEPGRPDEVIRALPRRSA